MQTLNLSRQLAKQAQSTIEVPSASPALRSIMSNVLDLHGASQKFLLPDGGRLFDDLEYKALDEKTHLRLPYPYIALEYHSGGIERSEREPIGYVDGKPQFENNEFVSSPKRVVFAREREGWIVLTIAFSVRHDGTWRVMPECAIPTINYLDRSSLVGGRVGVKVSTMNNEVPHSDYIDEVGAVLCFLNVLQCSNVKTEQIVPKNPKAKVKGALPFDTYHILTINVPGKVQSIGEGVGSSHRSPREHLRRGHIRTYESGMKVWVNAAVVNAGIGSKITKDYRIAA